MTKVLIIAPTRPALTKVPDEVAALSNRLPSVLLQGDDVTEDRIVAAVREEGSFEGFWFATDGGQDGAALSNNTIISAYSIAALLRIADAEWVVFNTCDSRSLVVTIQLLAPVDVVATEASQIADVEAWRFAKRLAVEFSQSGNMREAVSKAAPGSAVHRFYQNERNTMRQYANSNQSPAITSLQTDQTLEDKLDILMGWVDGDDRRGVKGLREQSGQILDRLDSIDEQLETANAERNSLSAKLATVQAFLVLVGLGVMAATLAIIWLFASRMT